MTDETPKPQPAPERLKLEDIVAPIFDAAMGKRLRLMRMKLILDQAQLGERLGIHASTVSDLELGKLKVPKSPFTLSQLKSVFSEETAFILFGRNPERFSSGKISGTFWFTKMVVDRDRTTDQSGDNHWTRKVPKGKRRRN